MQVRTYEVALYVLLIRVFCLPVDIQHTAAAAAAAASKVLLLVVLSFRFWSYPAYVVALFCFVCHISFGGGGHDTSFFNFNFHFFVLFLRLFRFSVNASGIAFNRICI